MTTANPNLFCGCPDDRCAGYHHAVGDPCGCVPLPLSCAVCGHETDAHPSAGACDLCPAGACQPIDAPADAVASTREAMLEAGRRETDARAAFLGGTRTAEAMRAAVEAWIEAVCAHRDAVAATKEPDAESLGGADPGVGLVLCTRCQHDASEHVDGFAECYVCPCDRLSPDVEPDWAELLRLTRNCLLAELVSTDVARVGLSVEQAAERARIALRRSHGVWRGISELGALADVCGVRASTWITAADNTLADARKVQA